ncbi:hypothetical protein [Burkholderia gladioli]|uniref:phage tail tube protein n=1 Tax=Burkholderia gladioli TaxID=28095 RepID=UPI00163EFA7C|nr:hypothetical protein [Burkholderia gladioli]
MPTTQYCCFKGRGEISLADYAKRIAKMAGFTPVGNAPVFNLTATETTENVKDYVNPAGGTACSIREIDTIGIALTLRCHSPQNWALATSGGGADAEVASQAIVDEPHVFWPGTVEPLANLIDESVAVVVKSVNGETTYTAGTDYELTPSGSLKALEGSTIPAPTVTMGIGQPNIHVSYTRKDQTLIQLYSQPTPPLSLHFDGYNVAEKPIVPVQFDLFRVLFGPAATVTVIGDNLSQLELTGTVERDPTRSLGSLDNPFSQFGTLKL